MNQILNKIKQLKSLFQQHKINIQSVINQLHQMQKICLKHHMNMDNYLYRNGILNKKTAIKSAKENINKFKLFADRKKKFEKELKDIQNSKQSWYENYAIHDSPYHDLIKLSISDWKVLSLLNSLICDLYVGTYNEGPITDLMIK